VESILGGARPVYKTKGRFASGCRPDEIDVAPQERVARPQATLRTRRTKVPFRALQCAWKILPRETTDRTARRAVRRGRL